MYEDEYLDDELDEGLEEGLEEGIDEEYGDAASSNSNISDRIKDKINSKNDELSNNIQSAKHKNQENKNHSHNDSPNNKSKSKNKNNNDQYPSKQLTKKNKPNRQNNENKSSDEIGNKINSAKGKNKNNSNKNIGSNGVTKKGKEEVAKKGTKEAAKKGTKEIAKKTAETGAKTAASVGSKAAMAVAGKWILIAVAILACVIFFIILLIVIVGAFSNSGSGGGTYGSYNPTSTDKTEFMCAMVNPLTNKKGHEGIWISSFYGKRNSGFHHGIDMGVNASDGEPIYAVQDGEISYMYSTSKNCDTCGYGTNIRVKHENGFTTIYAHLVYGSIPSTLNVGDKVKQGTVLGKKGNTGHSSGSHLHFEILDEGGKSFSINEYFGVTDRGEYANCIVKGSGATASQCGHDTQASAREGKINFQEDVCSKYNFDNGEINSTDIIGFVAGFEGTTSSCTAIDGSKGYKVTDEKDGTLTVGKGFTNHAIGAQRYTNIINDSGYSELFAKNGDHYKMTEGTCIPKSLADKLMEEEIASDIETVKKYAESNKVTLKSHQIDALASFIYQNGNGVLSSGITPLDSLLRAYKNYSNTTYTDGKNCADEYEGLWSKMGQYRKSGDNILSGLKKRRKAEFALFVTGDYTDQGLFNNRTMNDSAEDSTYDYYDSEGVMARKK